MNSILLSCDAADRDSALIKLGRNLRDSGYRFTTITPVTHAIVNARPENGPARSLRDVFGWSRPFGSGVLSAAQMELAVAAGILTSQNGIFRSSVRFSSFGDLLFVHSSFPTEDEHSVFFGPDSHRFAHVIGDCLKKMESMPVHIADIGCGSGIGGIVAARLSGASSTVLADINPAALRFSAINAVLNGVQHADPVLSDLFQSIHTRADFIISNPPYLADASKRIYRDGGGALGVDLPLRILQESLPRLRDNGTLLLYTGAPVVNGIDMFRRGADALLKDNSMDVIYREIDPDIFGEELRQESYVNVERIAAIALTVKKKGALHAS